MKRMILLLLVFACLHPVAANAAVLVFSANGIYVTKANPLTATISADCVGKGISITSNYTLSADITVPAGQSFSFANSARFKLNGYTFTYSGSTSAWPDAQVFDLSSGGSVTGNKNPTVKTVWFGDDPTGVADSWTATQAAINYAASSVGTSQAEVKRGSGIYSMSHPIDLKGVFFKSAGGMRPTPGWTNYVMSDGGTSNALVYFSGTGSRYEGSMISGSYADILATDVNGVVRCMYCVEFSSAAGQQTIHALLSNVKLSNASVANVELHNTGYNCELRQVRSSASPIGFALEGSYGPITMTQCYSVVCATGFKLMAGEVYLNSIATDACDIGVNIDGTNTGGQVSIDTWNCERVISPMQLKYASVSVKNVFYKGIGMYADSNTDGTGTYVSNTYSGQTGATPTKANIYMFSFYASDLTVTDSQFYLPSPADQFNFMFAGSARPSTPGVDDSRISLEHCMNMYGQINPRKALSDEIPNFWSAYAPWPDDRDTYTSGTFTPTILGNSTAGTTTYTAQVGTWVRENKKVRIDLSVGWSAQTGTGNILIGGQPFTSKSGHDSPMSITANGLTYSGQLAASNYAGSTYISLLSQTSGGLDGVPMDSSVSVLNVSGAYYLP